jgi:hypothetical protein
MLETLRKVCTNGEWAALGFRGAGLLDFRPLSLSCELANAIFEYLEIFHNRQPQSLSVGHAYPSRVREIVVSSASSVAQLQRRE